MDFFKIFSIVFIVPALVNCFFGLENLIPDRLIEQDTGRIEFLLYPNPKSLNYREELIIDDPISITSSKYNSSLPIILLIHGFVSESKDEGGFIQVVKNAYLKTSTEANIVAVDWSHLSTPKTFISEAFYKFAVTNVKKVGKRVADFIEFLIREKFLSGPQNVHIVGFSLGAQVGGKAGRYFNMSNGQLLHRITGLDPAGPIFNLKTSSAGKLDSGDAEFVDVVHTDKGQNGYYGTMGHVDFYPNGGGPPQPNCSTISMITGGCAHASAYRYFSKSIREPSDLIACQCDKYFLDSSCLENCKDPVQFGEFCPFTARGVYYLQITYDEEDMS